MHGLQLGRPHASEVGRPCKANVRIRVLVAFPPLRGGPPCDIPLNRAVVCNEGGGGQSDVHRHAHMYAPVRAPTCAGVHARDPNLHAHIHHTMLCAYAVLVSHPLAVRHLPVAAAPLLLDSPMYAGAICGQTALPTERPIDPTSTQMRCPTAPCAPRAPRTRSRPGPAAIAASRVSLAVVTLASQVAPPASPHFPPCAHRCAISAVCRCACAAV